jgi:hypothetical protein
MVETRLALGGFDRLRDGFHVQRPLRFIVCVFGNEALFPRS